MNKSIIALSALALCAATPAFANDKWFEKADTNGDGFISKAEHAAAAEEKFTKADTNGDGKLSKDETHAMHAAMHEKWKDNKHSRQKQGDMSKDGGAEKESIDK